MKANSKDMPLRLHDLGNGYSHFNYNVAENEVEGETSYDYNQVVVPNPPTYDKIIVALIRERYSLDDELAVIRQKETKPDEFQDYFDFVEDCKIIAKDEQD